MLLLASTVLAAYSGKLGQEKPAAPALPPPKPPEQPAPSITYPVSPITHHQALPYPLSQPSTINYPCLAFTSLLISAPKVAALMAGLWNGKTIRLEEIHRFPNGPVYLGDSLRWDVVRLWAEIQNGLALAGKKYGKSIVSVGADTWGVDYVLLTGCDEMLGQPYAYRDARTNGMMEKAFKKVPRAEIFAQTGLQFMQFNTLFQLLAHKQACPGLLEAADVLLMMPDFIHWALCGSRVVEFTNGTTTQCMHPLTRNWATRPAEEVSACRRTFSRRSCRRVPGSARCGPAWRTGPASARSTWWRRPPTTPPLPSPAFPPPTPARPTGLTSVPAPGR